MMLVCTESVQRLYKASKFFEDHIIGEKKKGEWYETIIRGIGEGVENY